MKKLVLFIALVFILMITLQCTEDDTVEASVQKDNPVSVESGEEGADGIDSDKDE